MIGKIFLTLLVLLIAVFILTLSLPWFVSFMLGGATLLATQVIWHWFPF